MNINVKKGMFAYIKMHQIFLYILFSTYYSSNVVHAQDSTAEQVNFA